MKMKSHTLNRACPAVLILTVACCTACTHDDGRSDGPITTDMHEDFDHEHKHRHTSNGDHEHEHEDGFRGSHSHGHTHTHRHGEPLHGGRIVSIGHTHHKNGATHFHAEVMPLQDSRIRFFLLTETDDGESRDHPIQQKEIPALVSVKGREDTAAEHLFSSVGDDDTTSEFALQIPESFAGSDSFSVVIPRVEIDGQRQNFSFTVTRTKTTEDDATDSEEDTSN